MNDMPESPNKLKDLLDRLESLSRRQELFQKEIAGLRGEISRLGSAPAQKEETAGMEEVVPPPLVKPPVAMPPLPAIKQDKHQEHLKKPAARSDFEKFVGENLINKIGIAITVIGVGIGAKYAIDHDLINPLTRIILGYLFGAGLLGFAIRLKKNYENFSAVLLSGAIAIMYFITYAAYSYYGLVPQAVAFVLMVIFTVFAVIAAIAYNRQVIAQIGLVGAYAVPFLLSNDTGKLEVLFSYMVIINLGILVIALRKYWKVLFYIAFALSWIIFAYWFFSDYETERHFGLALLFSSVFFSVFYLTFLAYKLINNEKFSVYDIIFLLANSFIYFGLGYSILNDHESGEQFLGLFTLINAIAHFIVSAIVYRKKLADKELYYLIAGLVLVFITIAVPVQLDGKWVTLLWAGESVLLFWVGTSKGISFYRKLSYPLMMLAFFSIIHDWVSVYGDYAYTQEEIRITPVLNIYLLSSVLVILSFAYINYVHFKKPDLSGLFPGKLLSQAVRLTVPAILIITIYFSFKVEIEHYWQQKFYDSSLEIRPPGQESAEYYQDNDLLNFKDLWVIGYSMLFLTLTGWFNFKMIGNKVLGYIILGLSAFALLVFLVNGLPALGQLRDTYMSAELSQYYERGLMNILIRYIIIFLTGVLLVTMHLYARQDFIPKDLKIVSELILYFYILAIASSELIHWLEMAHSSQSDKLGISILWGVYSLMMIVLGIMKKKKHLRIGAIALFGITLLKLFFYDISHLNTISKTIIFISLGILLLVISFLYNKYKILIADNHEK